MQVTTPVLSVSPKATAKPKINGKTQNPATLSGADPLDTFSQETQAQQERHLRMQQRAQLESNDRLHKERIAALFAQLHTQLFALWNEVWMQRQKIQDEAFKGWLKLLVA